MLCSGEFADLTLLIEELLELRRLQPRSKFVKKCEKKKLYIRDREGEQAYLICSVKSVSNDWKPSPSIESASAETIK